MKIFFMFLSLMTAQVSFAAETDKSKVKCYNESAAAALKFLIETRELELGSFKRYGLQISGVYSKTDSANNQYNVVMVATQNIDETGTETLESHEQILVKYAETYDNRCQIPEVDFDKN